MDSQPRDAAYWAKNVTTLKLGQVPAGAVNLNVTGRRVVAFLSQAHVGPDLAIEVFFLDGAVAANGLHETGATGADVAGT